MEEFPKDWALRTLGSLLRESRVPGSDGALAKKFSLRLHGRGALAKQERRPGSPKTKYYRRSAGQFVYSKLDFLNGAMAILPHDLDARESTRDLPAFDLGPELDPDWLLAFLSRPSFVQACRGLTRGSRHAQRMGTKEFLSIKVPLPSREEQASIAKLIARFDRARATAQEVLVRTRAVSERVLDRLVCPDERQAPVKPSALGPIPADWELVSLQDVTAPDRQGVMTGPYGSLLKRGDYQDSGVGVLKIGNLKDGQIDLEGVAYVSCERAKALDRYRLQNKDLLFARQGATTGKVAVVDERCCGYLMSYHLIRVAVDQTRCLSEFLAVYFRSSYFLSQLQVKKIKGTREGVNCKDLREVSLALPSLAKQAQIVAQAQRFASALAKQEHQIAELDLLKSQVLEDLLTGRVRTRALGECLGAPIVGAEADSGSGTRATQSPGEDRGMAEELRLGYEWG